MRAQKPEDAAFTPSPHPPAASGGGGEERGGRAGCVFCAIAAGQSAAEILLQEEAALAFLDIRPAAPGHTLVIPRSHFQSVWEIDAETGAAVMRLVVRVAQALRLALRPDGLTVLQNNGRAAGQEVPHAHWHLLPRWYGDGLHLARGPAIRPAQSPAEVARQVRAALQQHSP